MAVGSLLEQAPTYGRDAMDRFHAISMLNLTSLGCLKEMADGNRDAVDD